MRIIMTNSPETAAALNPQYTVEAEFGSVLVQGTEDTLAHHEAGKAAGFTMCPCSEPNRTRTAPDWNDPYEPICYESCIAAHILCVISHLDWDTIGGCLALMGKKPEGGFWDNIWAQIAFNDTNGAHKAHLSGVNHTDDSKAVVDAMYWWMTEPSQRIYAPRDGSAMDMSEFFERVENFLECLEVEVANAHDGSVWKENTPLLDAGATWIAEQVEVEKTSYHSGRCVIVRTAEVFVNHMYTHDDVVAKAVVGFNPKTGAVTLSFESEEARNGLNACTVMQTLFGPLAGGHAGIAGSPRGEVKTLEDAIEVAEVVAMAL